MKKPDILMKLKIEGKIELVEPSKEISTSYIIKSDNCLRSAKILFAENIYENSTTEAYYSMYNSTLSLLFGCGIKCENHTASAIILGRIFNFPDFQRELEKAKKERIDKQYYVVNTETTKESALQMIKDAENFILNIQVFIGKLDSEKILKIREKFNSSLN